MSKTPAQYVTELLIKFGRAFQLPEPSTEYIEAIYNALHANKWTLREFAQVLSQLAHDDKYAESARFGKYPMLYDYLRIKQQMKSKPFYEALTSYLSGNWWEKDNILALATPEQMNAITISGGLTRLFERANSDVPTPVYKLVDIISQNESDASSEIIETEHRIGKPASLKQITSQIQQKSAKNEKS